MPLSYKHNFKALDVGNAITEIAGWHLAWMSANLEQKPEQAGALFNLYEFFHDDVAVLDSYKKLKAAYEGAGDIGEIQGLYKFFFEHLKTYFAKVMKEAGGYDVLTGLKSEDAFERDIKPELEKLERYKKPFCLGMLRIDGIGNGGFQLEGDALLRCRLEVANVLQDTLRSFDDAYALKDGTFLVCVKEAASVDGMRAMERIRDEVDARNISYNEERSDGGLSVCSISAEPLEGEDIQETLGYLKQELMNNLDKKGQVLAYHEVSPLERFAKERE